MTRHIQAIYDEGTSWCGVKLENEVYFKSVDTAALIGVHDSKPIVCEACADKVIACLNTAKFIDDSVNSPIIPGRSDNDITTN